MSKNNTIHNKTSFTKAFTLVELLIVMAILGILASIALVSFRSSQARSRDAQRKADLKQITNALELYYSDYGKYPDELTGLIAGCPSISQTPCVWGSGEFTDEKTIYFKIVPKDPIEGFSYLYRIVDSGQDQKFQLFAHLENSQDPGCLGGDCASPTVSYTCGSKACNFALTSPNTKPTE